MKVKHTHSVQPVKARAVADGDGGNEVNTSEFKAFLDKSLADKQANSGNEEAVFSSIVEDGVRRTGTAEALEKFEQRIEKHRKILQRHAGHISEEKAGKFALRDLVRNDLMSKEDASKLYSMAFSAAQIDDDKEVLSDGMDGPGVVAATGKSSIETQSITDLIKEYELGSKTYSMRNLGEKSTGGGSVALGASAVGGGVTPSGTSVDGGAGFLFKPVSDTQSKLVVLTPEGLTGQVESVVLRDSTGKQLETGQFSGIGNGNRSHFRFTKPGGSYPVNLTVEIQLKGGGVKSYQIPNPNLRYD